MDKAVLEGGWTFCVEWLAGDAPSPVGRRGGGAPKIDYMKVLPPDVFARFAVLRERRREIALGEKISAFLVATDAQLAEMAKLESPTLVDWRGVDGFGDERIAKYGARLLGLPTAVPEGQGGSDTKEMKTP